MVSNASKSAAPNAAKAQGAIRRLTSTGKPMALKGAALDGGAADLAQYRGKVVLVHYWSTSSPTCKDDHETLAERRDACVDALDGAGFRVRRPQAAMYIWVPLPAEVASLSFCRRALEDEGVAVLGGAGFGPAGEGFFRIALTAGPDRLRDAVRRLARSLARVREEQLASTA